MSHSKAKLTAYGRRLLCERIRSGFSVRVAARMVGISHARAYLLWRLYREIGERAFMERSSRPHHSPRRLSGRVEARIERARRTRRWGPLRLQWLLGIARSTIYAVLRRLGISRRRDLDPRPAPPRRYERAVPGDLVHIDTKKLSRIGPGGGKVFGARPHSLSTVHVGYEYLHLAIDDRTRVWYVERLPSAGADAVASFSARALAFFADRGVRVRQVMSDNAFTYVHGKLFHAVLAAWGIEHVRIPPHTPRWNGKVEAAVGILLREWAYAKPYTSNRARAIALGRFVHSYNHRRIHGELGGLTPMQRLIADVNNVRGQHI